MNHSADCKGRSSTATGLLNETTVLYISQGKMAGTAESCLGMKETKGVRGNKLR